MKGCIIPFIIVEKLVFGGKGLARYKGKVVLIDGALTGEHLEIEITHEKKDYFRARIIKIIKAHPYRIKPKCAHFGLCGGCDWQYMSYPFQIQAKEAILVETMQRSAGVNLTISTVKSPKHWHYRCRGQWHWSGREWRVFAKGLRSQGALKECPVTHPRLFSALENSPKDLPIGRYQLILNGQSVLKEWQGKEVGSVKIKGKEIFFSVRGFFQNNWCLLESWIDFITKSLSGELLWDLYAGTGILSAFLGECFREIVLVESAGVSLKLARKNVSERAQLIQGSVLDFLRSTVKVADCVLVNPPRNGLGKAVCQELVRLAPCQLIYISCNPSTLARDISQLKSLFKVQEAKLFDFYPQTYHMEVVLKLERKDL